MLIIKKYLLLLFVGILFSACAPIYDFEPNYNKEKKVLHIDTLTFENSNLSFNRSRNDEGSNITRQKYLFKDQQCKEIFYFKRTMKSRWYIIQSEEDYITDSAVYKKKYKCDVTKISNLKFFSCEGTEYFTMKYTLTRSENNQDGYKMVSYLNDMDRKCFETLLSHYSKKAKEDNVEIKNYNLGR